VHAATAAEVFGLTPETVTREQRSAAKAINFGLMYGMSAFGLARQLGIGRGEAQDYIALYFSRFAGVRDYMERIRAQAREDGYVETVFGRRPVPAGDPLAQPGQRAGAERAAINAPMQGTAADIIKRAMVRWTRGCRRPSGATRADADAGARRTGVRGRRRLRAGTGRRRQGAHGGRGGTARPTGGRYRGGQNWDEAH
jgi:DNA polymerase-1